MTDDFNNEVKVIDLGVVRSADNWSVVIERAKKTTIDLSLHFKKTSVSHEESTSEYSSTAVSSDEDSELKLQSVRSDASDRGALRFPACETKEKKFLRVVSIIN